MMMTMTVMTVTMTMMMMTMMMILQWKKGHDSCWEGKVKEVITTSVLVCLLIVCHKPKE